MRVYGALMSSLMAIKKKSAYTGSADVGCKKEERNNALLVHTGDAAAANARVRRADVVVRQGVPDA
jgi:hypothetical protein